MNAPLPEILVSENDIDRLDSLLDRADAHDLGSNLLRAELDRARIVPIRQLPPKVVSMRSRVKFFLSTQNRDLEMTLVYPRELQDPEREVSVLSPVGAALLGLAEGSRFDWQLGDGRSVHLIVRSVEYQPEAEGVYDR